MAVKSSKPGSRKRAEGGPSRILNQEERKADWLDRLVHLEIHFGRFTREALGVILLALAAMVVLALIGGSEGVLLDFVATLLSNWFGWGS